MMATQECESCAESGEHDIPAIRHSANPDFIGYWLCEECATEYDSRPPVNQATITLPVWHCQRCEHTWIGRQQEKPQSCPKCRTVYWDKPRRQPK